MSIQKKWVKISFLCYN